MKLKDFMAERAVTALTGEMQAEDFVVAIDCSQDGTGTDVGEYAVAAVHVSNDGAAIESNTNDRSYYYEGKQQTRNHARRTFSIAGERFVGDEFQDFCCSHAVKFGKTIVRDYVRVPVGGGMEGEKGKLTINVTNDGSGAAGDQAAFAVSMASVGTPESYGNTAQTPF